MTGIAGDIFLVNDGSVEGEGGTVTDACQPLLGFPAGSIALVDRGTCGFTQKVSNAQAAGATAVIVANNVAGVPGTMGGTDPTITIPSVMVSQATAPRSRRACPPPAVSAPHPSRRSRTAPATTPA